MNMQIMKSGVQVQSNCIVQHKEISGLKFGLRKGDVLPNYANKDCVWWVINCAEDFQQFVAEVQLSKCKLWRTMSENDVCMESGCWEELGTGNKWVLGIGDKLPPTFQSIIVLKS